MGEGLIVSWHDDTGYLIVLRCQSMLLTNQTGGFFPAALRCE